MATCSFMTFSLRPFTHFFVYFLSVFLFCEYVIYFVVLLQCSWPQLQETMHDDDPVVGAYRGRSVKPLRIAMIADTHLLGPKRGHWFDKLRREWQMHRSFQTLLSIYSPQVVFFLGDIFDEGLWSNDEEFRTYVDRFHSLFSVSKDTNVYVVAGNHDIGFHYSITERLNRRFIDAFHSPAVSLLNLEGGNVFVLINSMALEGDNCFLCRSALNRLRRISMAIKCANKIGSDCDSLPVLPPNIRPILLQHFPMYRESDAMCEGPDVAPEQEKNQHFREKWDCISKNATKQLFDLLNPRVIFGGHTHHGCLVTHLPSNTLEWSVPSFSWRNRNNPSFLLVSVTPYNYAVNKCFLPQESTVKMIYFLSVVLFVAWNVILRLQPYLLQSHSKFR